jgi:hypothetical protein
MAKDRLKPGKASFFHFHLDLQPKNHQLHVKRPTVTHNILQIFAAEEMHNKITPIIIAESSKEKAKTLERNAIKKRVQMTTCNQKIRSWLNPESQIIHQDITSGGHDLNLGATLLLKHLKIK